MRRVSEIYPDLPAILILHTLVVLHQNGLWMQAYQRYRFRPSPTSHDRRYPKIVWLLCESVLVRGQTRYGGNTSVRG